MYTEAAQVFIELCQSENIDLPSVDVSEIGCGTGFYTQLLNDLGVKSYVGLDITDVLFPELRTRFPQFRFIKRDVTSDKIDGKFDVVIMIDVIQHIVNEDKLSFAMNNIKNCLAPNGIFILAPIANISRRSLFYVRTWSLRDFEERFPGYIFGGLLPFRGNYIATIKKP